VNGDIDIDQFLGLFLPSGALHDCKLRKIIPPATNSYGLSL
jgi:hypothetical protein